MQLKYYVPFRAQVGQEADLVLKEKLLNIEGVAIDTSVNANKWQVPPEDLDYFVSTLKGAQRLSSRRLRRRSNIKSYSCDRRCSLRMTTHKCRYY
jgi:hypothetical protein